MRVPFTSQKGSRIVAVVAVVLFACLVFLAVFNGLGARLTEAGLLPSRVIVKRLANSECSIIMFKSRLKFYGYGA